MYVIVLLHGVCRLCSAKCMVMATCLFTGLAIVERKLFHHQLGASSSHRVSSTADLSVSAPTTTLQ